MSIRLFCIADLHIGRRPSKLALNLGEPETPGEVLSKVVELAIREKVDACLFSGDLVDSKMEYFEAEVVLRKEIRKLSDAGIRAIAIAGNHDYDTLPLIADAIPELELLGREGIWESRILDTRLGSQLRIIGRSFYAATERANQLSNFPKDLDQTPTIAILHGDTGSSDQAPGDSPYGPLSRLEMAALPAQAWALGHLHSHRFLSEEPAIFYTSSLQPLDPGEPGAHGFVDLRLDVNGVLERSFVPLASVRYEDLKYQLKPEDKVETLPHQITQFIRKWCEVHHAELPYTRMLSIRLELTGRHQDSGALRRLQSSLPRDFSHHFESCEIGISSIINSARPSADLTLLAEGSDPISLLAKRLTTLIERTPVPDYERLITEGRSLLKRTSAQSEYLPLSEVWEAQEDHGEDAVRESMIQAGTDLLYRMQEQLSEADEPPSPESGS